MAGWIFHLRTAERILTGLPENPSSETELIHWYMGNLAPDCGVPVGFAEYVPPKDITHFKDGKYICPQTFARQYLQGEDTDRERYWFCLGYYAHLSTDVFWVLHVLNPEKKRFAALLEQDKKAFYALVKADWYDLETLWLGELYEAGKTFAPLSLLTAKAAFPNLYLDFFPPEAFTLRLDSLRAQYTPDAILPQLDRVRREYPVLSPTEEAKLLMQFTGTFSCP